MSKPFDATLKKLGDEWGHIAAKVWHPASGAWLSRHWFHHRKRLCGVSREVRRVEGIPLSAKALVVVAIPSLARRASRGLPAKRLVVAWVGSRWRFTRADASGFQGAVRQSVGGGEVAGPRGAVFQSRAGSAGGANGEVVLRRGAP